MSGAGMREEWDERARKNPLFYVDNRLDFDNPDVERFWKGGEEDLDAIAEMLDLEIGAGDRVLDIGCGVGRMSRALSRRAGSVVGTDISAEMLAQAAELNAGLDNVEWVHGSGTALEAFESGTFDGVFSHVVFQHIPDPAITLGYVREMGRILRPGGWAAFHVSTDPKIHQPPGGVMARLKRRVGAGSQPADAAWWGSALDVDALRVAATDGGMAIERIVGEGTQFTMVRGRRT